MVLRVVWLTTRLRLSVQLEEAVILMTITLQLILHWMLLPSQPRLQVHLTIKLHQVCAHIYGPTFTAHPTFQSFSLPFPYSNSTNHFHNLRGQLECLSYEVLTHHDRQAYPQRPSRPRRCSPSTSRNRHQYPTTTA